MKKSANDHHTQNTPAGTFEPLIAELSRRRWRAKSEFGQGLRAAVDQDARDVWTARVEIHRRAGRLTASETLVAQAMARKQGTDGRLDPSHKTIANDAGVSERTVRRAATSRCVSTQPCLCVNWPGGSTPIGTPTIRLS